MELVKDFGEQEEPRLPGAYVVNRQLFFKLKDGTVVLCTCIAEPYAGKVVEACNYGRIY
jgi:hypothetical protein